MSRKYYIICLLFAFWTVLQTTLHIYGVILVYYWGTCEGSPSTPGEILFYLTYLYKKSCPKPKLSHPNGLVGPSMEAFFLTIVESVYNSTNLETVVQDLLNNLERFPDVAAASSRTLVFMLCFIILDGTWIVSAVALLMGTCFGIKGPLVLVFYCPWLIMTISMCLFDVTTSVIFGIDIPNTINFNSWLTFVGMPNTSDFDDFLAKNPSDILSVTPSLVLCTLCGRFVFVVFSNFVGFILVMKATISVFRETDKNQTSNQSRSRTNSESPNRKRSAHDTSADRIRNWQLFYGAIDTTSTHSSKSAQSDRDLTSNSIENGEGSSEIVASDVSDSGNATSYYYAYSDVAEGVVGDGATHLEELRGQLPWSYVKPQEELRGRLSGEEKVKMENRTRRSYRIKSDTSNSDTEL